VTDEPLLADKLSDIKRRLIRKEISYEEARAEAEPIIVEMNKRARDIATKHGRKHRPWRFESLMRAL